MQIAHAHAQFRVVLGQVLGHPLRERRHQDALLPLDDAANLAEQIVHLPDDRPDFDRRIDEPRRADDLLDDHAAAPA